MQRHWLSGLWLLMALLLLTACTSPHYLQPNPKVTADIPQAGGGQQVTVNVVDGRESEVLGTRSGAAMSTATITVYAHDLIPKLQAQAEQAVRQMGFTPTTESVEGRPSLTLTLTRLGYERGDSQPVLGNARLEVVFRSVAKNDGYTYTGTYTSRREQSYAIRPNREDNTNMVNELLSDGLNRAFRDPELGRLLAR
ncbi:lipoprotein [Litchfieldella qijiaojingensis]|uniref:Lipoprotein n=1 Tax=Litchfieldella qijiaojingensis TaxID=980347 RepID=A0ABQ2YV17_9GAMM|nr:YajG family lipoprotein [Halomonas qijiaojingensis]GGX96237.1 lipoprotein [Halomonas qijiaojingensis]